MSIERTTQRTAERTKTRETRGYPEKKIVITKIRDSEAGGLPSVKNEDFFHGFMPREQVGLPFLRRLRKDEQTAAAYCLSKTAQEAESEELANNAILLLGMHRVMWDGNIIGVTDVIGAEKRQVNVGKIRFTAHNNNAIGMTQTDRLLLKVGDFLVRQAVRAESRSTVAEQYIISVRIKPASAELTKSAGGVVLTTKTDEEIAADRRRAEEEMRHVYIKYSRRAKLYYVRLYGFKLVSGLIEYHKRHKIPIDEEKTIIKRAIKKADWQLNHEQIIKTKRLGSGAFGDVYKGILRSGLIDKKEVAIKTINGSISAEENEKLFQEAMLMKTLVHQNVIQLIGVASNEEPVMIVMELAPGGAVLDAVQAKPGPSTYIRIKYCHGAAQGLTYLSGKGIIHRDIAARNTLIGKGNVAKISDFGLSVLGAQKKEKTLKKVPVRYLAPETLQTRSYSTKTDVWTFGIFMWEVFHDGMTPYDEFPNTAAIRKFVLAGNRLNNESDRYPDYLWTLTQECWKQNGADRPTFQEITTAIETQMEEYNEAEAPFWKFWS